MIETYIKELVTYGLNKGLVDPADEIYVTNRLLELFDIQEYNEPAEIPSRPLVDILNDMLDYAYQHKLMEDDTITNRDLFDTKIMGMLTPAPSVVRKQRIIIMLSVRLQTIFVKIVSQRMKNGLRKRNTVRLILRSTCPSRRKTQEISRKQERQRNPVIQPVCSAVKTKVMPDISHILPDRTTGSFLLP
mgnify:CR=1 FL=1